jgi:DNA-binding response OmpR family regulator
MNSPDPATPDAPSDDPVVAMREARLRFVAAFPKRADSIGLLLNMVISLGTKGPLAPLVEIIHRTAGLAGTLGFPTVSERAKELETMLDGGDTHIIDGARANRVFDNLRDGFAEDLAGPPDWSTPASAAPSSRRIMVVEDDEDQREVVTIHLRAAGFAVVPVTAGDQVLSAAREHHPDLILLDANLPGQDGYSVCRALKADPELAGTPVIFTTVRAKLDDKAVGLMLGADDYLTKPLDLGELPLRISVLLDRRHRPVPQAKPVVASTATDSVDLDYESFVAVCRENLSKHPVVLALVRVPELRLTETLAALHADLRRRDVVACYDSSHLILMMVELPPAKAADRLSDIVNLLGPGTPSQFLVGVAYSPAAGAKRFEVLLGEADRAVASARAQRVAVAIAEG